MFNEKLGNTFGGGFTGIEFMRLINIAVGLNRGWTKWLDVEFIENCRAEDYFLGIKLGSRKNQIEVLKEVDESVSKAKERNDPDYQSWHSENLACSITKNCAISDFFTSRRANRDVTEFSIRNKKVNTYSPVTFSWDFNAILVTKFNGNNGETDRESLTYVATVYKDLKDGSREFVKSYKFTCKEGKVSCVVLKKYDFNVELFEDWVRFIANNLFSSFSNFESLTDLEKTEIVLQQ